MRLSSNALSAAIGATIVAVLSAGTAVAVTTSSVSITDASSGTRAHVTGNQALTVAVRDPYSGSYAAVSNGAQVVNARDAVPYRPAAMSADIGAYNTFSNVLVATMPKVSSRGAFEVETVSVEVRVPNGQRPTVWISYRWKRVTRKYYLPVIYQAPDGVESAEIYSGAMDVHLYVDAGTQINVIVDRHAYSQFGSIHQFRAAAEITGHTG